MMDKIYKLPEVKQSTGLSRSTIYELMGQGKFPKPIPLTDDRSVGWLESELEAWLKKRIEMRKYFDSASRLIMNANRN